MKLRRFIGLFALSALLTACDEGKIYPDTTIDSGRTATITLHFKGLDAWPQRNSLSLISLGQDGSTPLGTKRLLKPSSEEEVVTTTINNLSEDTRTIALAVVSTGLSVIYTYCTFSVNDADEAILLPETTVTLPSFHRIQEQVFNMSCVACHGGSTSTAGQLDLTPGHSYAGLVNVKAPHSTDGKNYVTPGDASESYLLDIFGHDNHSDIFNSSGKREILALIEAWIEEGAENN